MKFAVDILALMAFVTFVVGVFLRLLDASLMGMVPVHYWRFTIACLGFAMTLALRDLAYGKR